LDILGFLLRCESSRGEILSQFGEGRVCWSEVYKEFVFTPFEEKGVPLHAPPSVYRQMTIARAIEPIDRLRIEFYRVVLRLAGSIS